MTSVGRELESPGVKPGLLAGTVLRVCDRLDSVAHCRAPSSATPRKAGVVAKLGTAAACIDNACSTAKPASLSGVELFGC